MLDNIFWNINDIEINSPEICIDLHIQITVILSSCVLALFSLHIFDTLLFFMGI